MLAQINKYVTITCAHLFNDHFPDKAGADVGDPGQQRSFHEESSNGCRKDEVRTLVRVCALCFLQCFDTVGWVTGRTSGP